MGVLLCGGGQDRVDSRCEHGVSSASCRRNHLFGTASATGYTVSLVASSMVRSPQDAAVRPYLSYCVSFSSSGISLVESAPTYLSTCSYGDQKRGQVDSKSIK